MQDIRSRRNIGDTARADEDLAVFQEAFDQVHFDMGNIIMESCRAEFVRQLALCESPIERKFFAALYGCLGAYGALFFDRIALQEKIGPYRADFVLRLAARKDSCAIVAVIECDGHEFHEKTKAQAAHDKKRDRYFTERGMIVVRLTGSEIWADPYMAAQHAVATIWGHADARVLHAKRLAAAGVQ